ncbi:MAG: HD domain-containing phosphohydrolase [Bythopirellula sp.]|nr:HD domain-containing phosphohydrolase [Bythopirellula sp.]
MSPAPGSVQIKIDELRSGSRLSHSILDADDVLLLAAGTVITEPIKQRLLARGITTVYLNPQDAASMLATPAKPGAQVFRPTPQTTLPATSAGSAPSAKSISELNTQIANFSSRVSLSVDNIGPPLKNRQRRATIEPYDPQQRQRLVKQFATTKKLMDTMIRHAIAGLSQDTRAVRAVANGATAELVQDPDQTISTSAEVSRNPEITERAVRISVLAMAIAMEMGWDEELIREVGACGLVHDWGMFRLGDEICSQRAVLSETDRKQMTQHPLYTFEMLEKMRELPDSVRFAAAQVHEKLDGSGYPQQLKDAQIHPYAKILHVADAYVSLTEETWGRPAYIAYDVMVYLLSQVKTHSISLDAVRALLNVVALFPIGSHVQLSDGSEARVIRRGVGAYTEPVVQRVGADRRLRTDASHSSIVDLSQSELTVSAPLPHPTRQEQRIADTSTSAVLWE